jgi:predicted regulator of Ras-like GTPase activity (Roadblock/LC7/MglB family)
VTTAQGNVQPVINLLSEVEGVRAAILVRRDGTPVGDAVTGEDEELLGALTGAIFGTINKAMKRTGLGELSDVVVTAELGSIQAMGTGDYVIVVLADRASNIGMIRLEMRRAAGSLSPASDASSS